MTTFEKRPEPLELSLVNVLDFEQRFPDGSAAKASRIRATFDVKPARYYQVLSNIIHGRELDARRHNAHLTARLIEQHERRRAARATRTFRL